MVYYFLGVPNYFGICGGASGSCSCSVMGGNGSLGSSCYHSTNKVRNLLNIAQINMHKEL